ncbi:unnamed protein product [Rhizopus stolonifer]
MHAFRSLKTHFLQTRYVTITGVLLAILYFRSFHLIYFTCGAIFTTIEAKILKHIIKQPRPDSNRLRNKTTYGMPSSHSQAISFFATYFQQVALFLSPKSMFGIPPNVFALLLDLFSFSVIWSRVYLGHHTKSQVFVGTALGIVSALGWFRLWQAYFQVQ